METYKILVVDDEEHILELIEYNLIQSGFSVLTAISGEEALQILNKNEVDLVLLDIMMDGIDGIEVLKHIRGEQTTRNLPVILLTAKSSETDKVSGLEMGADDYIAKPFGVRELAARIKAVLRRSSMNRNIEAGGNENSISTKKSGLVINKTTREVSFNGHLVELALKEFELLYLLVKYKGVAFSREQILEKVWGYDYPGETRTVDVHIRNIRKKLEEKGMSPECIRTVRGVGYKYQQEE